MQGSNIVRSLASFWKLDLLLLPITPTNDKAGPDEELTRLQSSIASDRPASKFEDPVESPGDSFSAAELHISYLFVVL